MRSKMDLNKDERYWHQDIKRWSRYCSMFYNGLLDKMKITKKFSQDDLRNLELHDWVAAMSNGMGIGTLETSSYPCIPDLTRQFLASVELGFADNGTNLQLASEGTLLYLAYEIYYSISVPDLCTLYGFDPIPKRICFPDATAYDDFIWDLIAVGSYSSGTTK